LDTLKQAVEVMENLDGIGRVYVKSRPKIRSDGNQQIIYEFDKFNVEIKNCSTR